MSDSSWKIIAASVAGTSHVEKSLPCQDAFVSETFDAADGEVLIIVAADGAGSAKHAKIGAETACKWFADYIRSNWRNGTTEFFFRKDLSQISIVALQSEFAALAARDGGATSDYACTLLAAAVGQDKTFFWQIGDGAIVYQENDDFKMFTAPQQGEYANSTHFVTDSTAIEFLQIGLIEKRIDEIAVFTDGLQRIALDLKSGTAHAPFFRPMFAPLQKDDFSPILNDRLVDFLKSPKINERTDDDKTLILASRKKQ